MDYRSTLKNAMTHVSSNSSIWLNPSIRAACVAIATRAAQGPILTKEISYISTLMPLSYYLQLRPIITDGGTAMTKSTKIDGLQTWYWGFGTLSSDSGTLNTDSAVLFSVKRITINSMGTENVSTWVVTAGAMDPVTKVWITHGPVFLDDSHVTRSSSGIEIVSKHVKASMATAPNGSLFNFRVNFIDAGFEFFVSGYSVRGFVNPGQEDVVSHGCLSEARTLSIVDGAVTSQVATHVADVTDLVNTLSIRTSGSAVDGFYRYTKGSMWLDIKTLGLQHLSKLNVFLASMLSRSHMYHRRISVKLQFSNTQLHCLITDPTSVHSILAHQPTYCKHTVCIWRGTGQPQYGLDATILVKAVFPKSHAPSTIDVNIPGVGNFVLTSQATTKPLTPDFNGAYFLSACHLTCNGKNLTAAAAVLEWVPGDLYPQESEAVKMSGLWGIQRSWEANQSARAVLSLAFIAVISIYVCGFLGIAYLLPSKPLPRTL